MGPDKGTDIGQRVMRRLVMFAMVVGAIFVVACGGGDSDAGPAAQPTSTTTSQATAAAVSDDAPTPNPTSVNEIVFAVDFELPRAGGGTLKLSDAYAQANTVLVFYRGYF